MSTSASDPFEGYPAWFWQMPIPDEALFAVGVSETYVHPDTSGQNAIEDGLDKLARCYDVRIQGEQGVLRGHAGVVASGRNLHEEVSPTTVEFIAEHHEIVATYVGRRLTFVLLRIGEGELESLSGSHVDPRHRPPWITMLPREEGYLYASGHSNSYYHESNSWAAAERHARTSLAWSIEADTRGLSRRSEQQTSSIITSSTDVRLSRIQVVARWKDPETGACHVLVRVKTEQAGSLLYFRTMLCSIGWLSVDKRA